MTASPAELLRLTLTRLSNDYRRTVAYYGNVQGRPGFERQPRRLLSDYGFLRDPEFTYLVPAPALVIPGSDRRPCASVTIHPYGVVEDHRRLTSRRPADRVVRSGASTDPRAGVAPLDADPALYVSAQLDAATVAPEKTATVVERAVDARRGPAYHFVLSRSGTIVVASALDDQTFASARDADSTIDVAVEAALAIRREDHAAQRFDRLVELPYTPAQLVQLATLVAKLRTAYPAIGADGVRVAWPTGLAGTSPYNLVDPASASAFAVAVTQQGPFDLATQVFRPPQGPAPVATRAVAQAAIGRIDTVGEQTVALGSYATLAGAERAADMQATPRRQFFVQRINVAHADADAAGGAAADHAEAGSAASASPGPATETAPHVYDFTTGRWGDGGTF